MKINKQLITFVALSFGLAWMCWIPLILHGTITEPGIGWPTHIYGLLAPLFSAVITTALFEGLPGLRSIIKRSTHWRAGVYWLAVAAILIISPIAYLVSGQSTSLEALFTYSGVAGSLGPLLVFLIVLIANGYGEEVGWRGYLVEKLMQRYSLIKTSLITAVIWGAWHLPLFFIVQSFTGLGIGGAVGWFIGLTSGSVLLAWLYRGSKHSILLVALWHTLFNFTSATSATAHVLAPITSSLVMIAAITIVTREVLVRRVKTASKSR